MLTTTTQQAPPTGSESSSGIPENITCATGDRGSRPRGADSTARVSAARATEVQPAPPPGDASSTPRRPGVDRGLTTVMSPLRLRDATVLRALSALNRFRVIRTFDLAALCGPERPFKAALTAAQKAMRGLKKAGLVHWYRTDRQQHVYGLTKKGADLLQDHGVEAKSSVRRVSDMTNPEHMLWASFIAVCCEVRGLTARTEAEFLRELNRGKGRDDKLVQGLLNVSVFVGKSEERRLLRPDVVAYEQDGATWFEIDRSKRGSAREASLSALFVKVGAAMLDGKPLKRVVVLAKTDRILGRALALARGRRETEENALRNQGSRVLRELGDGVFEVIGLTKSKATDGRSSLRECVLGHVVVQMLPTWLPKLRLAKGEEFSTAGWFAENYLPYRRPSALGAWPAPRSPFLPFEATFCPSL